MFKKDKESIETPVSTPGKISKTTKVLNTPHTAMPADVSVPTDNSTTKTKVTEVVIQPQGVEKTPKKSLFSRKHDEKHESQQSYANDVYKSRFRHFRTLRLLSLLVGVSIFLVLVFGMWQLYTMVFSTIEDTRDLFLITEKRKTQTIDFSALEGVRAAWNEKYSTSSTLPTKPLFPEPVVLPDQNGSN
ncbi:MAG: hypothetical protein COV60_01320 [Candidatus Magasanikbacteria bacterium CG11_big_fil_rev_8_21_14_0_20_43_7]|uniref:Uncharacterized protein n=1 Tax=Candidatus Magasanikbacteria bacterium CG11_big_fil_rev_8_21_14_0_20_43_7 TaxID=1974654 RepID=A0A2H0N585_9BACT|nr:MAG: hypothetical protein COV60_01320 [Candidatus Magasanikbacteria bacterium CG11_big_fil_rev_8_21_14_0_20_43_7]